MKKERIKSKIPVLMERIEELYQKLKIGTIDERIKILSRINELKLKIKANQGFESSKKQYSPDYIHITNFRK